MLEHGKNRREVRCCKQTTVTRVVIRIEEALRRQRPSWNCNTSRKKKERSNMKMQEKNKRSKLSSKHTLAFFFCLIVKKSQREQEMNVKEKHSIRYKKQETQGKTRKKKPDRALNTDGSPT